MGIAASAARLVLPDDPTVDALPDTIRRAIAAHWLHRATSEWSVASAFTALAPRLRGVGAHDVVLTLVQKAIDDEQRHGELCVRLAARYLGQDVVAPSLPVTGLPEFRSGSERSEVLLLMVGMSCINESIASEWIRASWRRATAPLAQAANRAHLEDEIDHARLGWAHLASDAVSDADKRALAPWLPKLVGANLAEWRRPDEHLPVEGVPAHGHLAVDEHLTVVEAALRNVVMPGFAHVGITPLRAARGVGGVASS